MHDPQPIGTCAILLNDKRQVLLGKRKNSYKAGVYGLPGGRIELNEPIVLAIKREVEEETGIKLDNFKYLGVVRENQGDYDFIHFVYVTHVGNAEPKLCEPDKCEGWEWLELDQDSKEILPGHVAAIRMYTNRETLTDMIG